MSWVGVRGLSRDYAIALFWGIAEASVFFIVPDVLLSWIALKKLKKALWACAWAVLGALIGGTLMWRYGIASPEPAHALLLSIPAIDEIMLQQVRSQLHDSGLMALFVGPLIGTPYKIYAVQAASQGFGLLPFLLISIPARLMRFALVTLISAAASGVLSRFVGIRAVQTMHIVVWIAFYSWYFYVMSSG